MSASTDSVCDQTDGARQPGTEPGLAKVQSTEGPGSLHHGGSQGLQRYRDIASAATFLYCVEEKKMEME
jgi:hypothetical protein